MDRIAAPLMRRSSRRGLPIRSQHWRQSSRRLRRWTPKTARRGFDCPQGDKRLGLLHRGRDRIDDRHADQIPRARRETGEGRAGEDSNIGVALRNRFVGKIDERWPVRFARVLKGTEAAIERDNARTAAFEAVHRDAVAIPARKARSRK